MSHNPIAKITDQVIDYFAINSNKDARSQRYGELIRCHNEDLLKMGDLSIAASKINWLGFSQKNGMQLRIESDPLLPDTESMDQLVEHSKTWLFPLLNVSNLRKERYALRFQRAPIIANVLGSILQLGDNYGKQKQVENCNENMPTLCLTLHEQFGQLEGGNIKGLHAFRAKQLLLIVRRLLDYGNYRLVEPEEQTDDTLMVSVDCNNQSRRFSNEQLKKNYVRLVCGPVLEPTKKKATILTSDSYMA